MSSPWYFALDPRILTVSASLTSAALLLRSFLIHGEDRNLQSPQNSSPTAGDSGSERTRDFVSTVVLYASLRLVGCLVVLSLLISDATASDVYLTITSAMCLVFIYLSSLSFSALLVDHTTRRAIGLHLRVVLLTSWLACVYRYAWPALKGEVPPLDGGNVRTMWIHFAILFLIAVAIPLATPREYIPDNPQEKPNEEQTASPWSRWTFSFVDGIISSAQEAGPITDELLPLADADRAEHLAGASFPTLDPVSSLEGTSLLWGILKVFKRTYIGLVLLHIAQVLISFVSPIGVNMLLRHLEVGSDAWNIPPWFWVSLLFFGPFCQAIVSQQYSYIASRTMVRVEVILTQLIFTHSLRLRVNVEDSRTSSDRRNVTGRINNLATSDVANVAQMADVWVVVLLSPLQIVLSIVFLYPLLGWGAFAGLAVMLLCLPVPGYLARITRAYQGQRMRKTDARVQAVMEVVNALRMVKMFGWEEKASERVHNVRKEELVLLRKIKILELLSNNFNFFIPLATMIATFATYAYILQQPLTPSRVFASIAVFENLRLQLRQVMKALPSLVQGKTSLDRLDGFLRESELLSVGPQLPERQPAPPAYANLPALKDVEFRWSMDQQDQQPQPFSLRIRGALTFHPGVNLITGPVACGKSSFLLALLGEMHASPLGTDSWCSLPRGGGIAYAPQEPWILNETIRENIVFGLPFDSERYQKVIHQCALRPDLAQFEASDSTEIGERGMTLSGGQKARIGLARAVYSFAAILLLDDVLSALDVQTANWIMQKCFRGDLLRGRTVLLVTHNTALASPCANTLTVIDFNGEVSRQPILLAAPIYLPVPSALPSPVSPSTTALPSPGGTQRTLTRPRLGRLITAEEVPDGHVETSAFALYASSLSRFPAIFWILLPGAIIANEACIAFQAWFLGIWASQYEIHPPSEVSISYYLTGYSLLLLFSVMVYSGGYTLLTFGSIRASKILHHRLMQSLLRTTWRWLDTTPVSRVIIRATQDMRAIDGPISFWMRRVLDIAVGMAIRLGAIVIFNPLFIFPGVLITALGGFLGQLYMTTQLRVKREMSIARSPVLGHLGSVIQGVVSIRAFGVQERFLKRASRHIDRHARASLTYHHLSRWISIRSDALGGLFAASLGAYLIYGHGEKNGASASQTGFSLTMALGFSSLILTGVRVLNNFELSANSLERILQFLRIEQEPGYSRNDLPPAYWPTSGQIRVEGLTARHSDDGPDVLRSLSFIINSGERVGIVGRTGAGKSSLILSLLQCIPTQGQIFLDGVLTSSINLNALRSKITVIPQDPELLSGTLRYNLDPYGEHDDADLNDALRSAGLPSVRETQEGRLGLDSQILPGGQNLSVGQKQVIALARALVRGSKVMILDEATSSIDSQTDAIIQNSLRSHSRGVTILTVAHRLRTIMDFDKIMVLHAGRIVEYNEPALLLQNQQGYLRAMVDESPDRDWLRQMAGGRSRTVA
ncbi:hypothetical protein BDN72DRAFT_834451 [Pluteus cervinus]|uniref:Uncharacterized protein n=1 Tax=Pluteus cervinus TaxID=181527 RepID=A0ACD3B6W3_9AGAR|nr:hypothetical protein BDN72DRAFT_834451 [Pluteus cervinus]